MIIFAIFFLWATLLNIIGCNLLCIAQPSKAWCYPTCTLCSQSLSWINVIPFLQQCTFCKQEPLFLHPFFEFFIASAFMQLYQTNVHFISYFILFSALSITIRTDLQCMLISRFASLYLVPIGLLAAYYGWLNISYYESLTGAFFGYLSLYLINLIFYSLKKQNGVGQGDFELMALIGSFTGPLGCWFSTLVGSTIGTILAGLYMLYTKSKIKSIPFGPFLSIGAMLFVIYKPWILNWF